LTELEIHYRKNYSTLVNFYRKYVGNESEDLVQEAYCKVLSYKKPVKDFDRFFNTVISNLRTDWFRKRNNNKSMIDDLKAIYQDVYDENSFELPSIEMKEIEEKLSLKRGITRRILELSLYEGMSVYDIMIVLDIKPNTIYKTINRFKTELVS